MSATEIAALAHRIARSDPKDPREQASILEELEKLPEEIDGPRRGEALKRIESATLLARYLGLMGGIGGEDVLALVTRLVSSLQGLLEPPEEGARLPRAALPAARTAYAGGTGEDLLAEQRPIEDLLLGELLVRHGTIDSSTLDRALDLQGESGLRLGDVFVAMGAASRTDVQRAVGCQEEMRREAAGRPSPAPAAPLPAFRPVRRDLKLVSDVLLGDVLVKLGRVTPADLEQGLRLQRASGKRIGEALVELGATTWDDVREALRVQSQRRAAPR